jgi:hypothetical protein
MRLSRLLSKHSADASNIKKSNSVKHFNLCARIVCLNFDICHRREDLTTSPIVVS